MIWSIYQTSMCFDWREFMKHQTRKRGRMKVKTSWWSLTIQDYPNFKPNETDLEHIAKCIIDGYDQGELVQETEDEEDV